MLPLPIVESIKQSLVGNGFMVAIRQFDLLVWDDFNVRYEVNLTKPFVTSRTSFTNPSAPDRSEEISRAVKNIVQSFSKE